MTQKRQLPEQIASHTYKKQLPKESFKAIEKKVERTEETAGAGLTPARPNRAASNEPAGAVKQGLTPARRTPQAGFIPARSSRAASKEETRASNRGSGESGAAAKPQRHVVTNPKTDPSTAWNAFAQRQ